MSIEHSSQLVAATNPSHRRGRRRLARKTRTARLGLAVAVTAAGLAMAPAAVDAGPATPQTFSDYDGDGRTDTAVWRPDTGTWWFHDSSNGAVRGTQWGMAGDWPVPADYDGDRRTDAAVWRASTGEWWIVNSATGGVTRTVWGGDTEADDIPVPGDYDGDGRADIAIWRPATGVWWIINSSNGVHRTQQWGAPGDWPVPGDYDGDHRTDIAIWRPATGVWWIVNSATNTVRTQQWGSPGDWPVPGDYDGDGRTDTAIWRPATGTWWILNSSNWTTPYQQFGDPEDQPVPGDYDGDGRTDTAIWRPGTGTWWILNSATSAVRSHQFGTRGDLPVANTQQFVPKLRLQSLTPGAEAEVVDQGVVSRQVPNNRTMQVLVRGNPRVTVSTAKSTSTNCLSFNGSGLGTATSPLVTPQTGSPRYFTEPPTGCSYTSHVSATWRAGAASGTITGTFTYDALAFDRTFSVPENRYFVDTGIDLQAGDGVVIEGSGSIWSGVFLSGTNGPDGWPGRFGAGVPAPNAPVYSLVAHVGGALPAFYVGPYFESDTLGSGRLFLRINDEAPGNGAGAFTARVRVYR